MAPSMIPTNPLWEHMPSLLLRRTIHEKEALLREVWERFMSKATWKRLLAWGYLVMARCK